MMFKVKMPYPQSLNPRFDGAFLNSIQGTPTGDDVGLNPRFDGAFLNFFEPVKMA